MRRSERCGCFWIILRSSSKCASGSAEENCIARSIAAMDTYPGFEKATPANGPALQEFESSVAAGLAAGLATARPGARGRRPARERASLADYILTFCEMSQ